MRLPGVWTARLRFGALTAASMTAGLPSGPTMSGRNAAAGGLDRTRISAANAEADAQLKEWWTEFHDPVLTRLVGDVIDGNLQLQIARQNMLEARAARTVGGIPGLPADPGRRSGTANRSSETLTWPPGIGYYRSYSFGFNASWELDVFGGIRRASQAADADIQATIENRRAIPAALLAELATDYAELRATQLRLDIARHNLGVARRALDLTITKVERGLTMTTVPQARAQMESGRPRGRFSGPRPGRSTPFPRRTAGFPASCNPTTHPPPPCRRPPLGRSACHRKWWKTVRTYAARNGNWRHPRRGSASPSRISIRIPRSRCC